MVGESGNASNLGAQRVQHVTTATSQVQDGSSQRSQVIDGSNQRSQVHWWQQSMMYLFCDVIILLWEYAHVHLFDMMTHIFLGKLKYMMELGSTQGCTYFPWYKYRLYLLPVLKSGLISIYKLLYSVLGVYIQIWKYLLQIIYINWFISLAIYNQFVLLYMIVVVGQKENENKDFNILMCNLKIHFWSHE